MYTIIYLYSSFIYIGASLYSSSFLSFFHPFLHLHKERWKRKLVDYLKNNWKGCKYMYTQEIVCIWVIHIWKFKDLVLVWERRGQQFFCLQSLRVFFIINNVHHYLSLFIIYIYWRISIFKLFPFFLPSFCYIPKKDERERWLTISKNYWKGCRYMYIQEIVCIWVIHIWKFKDLVLVWERRGQQFFCLQSLRVFLLLKMGVSERNVHM